MKKIYLVLALLLLVNLFIPYASATKEHKEWISTRKEQPVDSSISFTNGQAENLSVAEYAYLYFMMFQNNIQKNIALVRMIVTGAIILFSLLSAIFSATAKPIRTIVFSLLTLGAYWALHFEFSDTGTVPSSKYGWSIASYAGYILPVVMIVFSICYKIRNGKKSVTETAA